MIDELDVFNAQVTLALARLARFPESAYLSRDDIGALEPKDRKIEEMAAQGVFGGRLADATWFHVYKKFWQVFQHPADPVQRRITLNAPAKAAVGAAFAIVTDTRLGPAQPVPEAWAAGLSQFDDFLFFSDEQLQPQQLQLLLQLIRPGATITLVRPSLRCDWFGHCGVKHDFMAFLEELDRLFVVEKVHNIEDPILTTVIGINSFR